MDVPPPNDEVLRFWLGPLDARGRVDDAHRGRWFAKDDALDAEIRARFAALHDEVLRGAHDGALQVPRGRLAILIVLDQLSRNMFRGTPRAFSF